jgi:pseudouridine-5'-phosphate glycosidase
LEHIVRSNGAVPATIALIDGDICVGVSDEQLQLLADCRQRAPVKISRRDLPSALVDVSLAFLVVFQLFRFFSQKSIGGTTVAASIYIAHLAGIRVFATGGIGGVHRGANESTFSLRNY